MDNLRKFIKAINCGNTFLKNDLNEARKRLLGYFMEIREAGKKYDSVFSFFDIPEGNVSMEEEIEKCLAVRRQGGAYEPNFVYPKLQKLDGSELRHSLEMLEKIKERIENEVNNDVRIVAGQTLANYEAKIRILLALKSDDKGEAFRQGVAVYGDINDDLVAKAKRRYEERIKVKTSADKSPLEMVLEAKEFDAEDIKRFFELALKKSGDNSYKVIVDDEVRVCTVDFNNEKYKRPVILIPHDRKVNGRRLLELIAHEIGIHSLANKRNNEFFGGLGIGGGWETAQEGFAILNEVLVMQEVLKKEDPSAGAPPYYILAMAKVRESMQAGQKPDLLSVYDYIYDLEKREIILDKNMPDDISTDEEVARNAHKETKNVVRRVFRGTYPNYFPKDKAYLEGEFIAREMKARRSDIYEYSSKTDPKILPNLIRLGFFSDTISLQESCKSKDVAIEIWNDVLKAELETDMAAYNLKN